MKQPPRPNEPTLTHTTATTGDSQMVALSPDNFNSLAVDTCCKMLTQGWNVAGFRLTRNGNSFIVSTEHGPLTRNTVEWDEMGNITLTTTMLPGGLGGSQEIMHMATDLEQCAALALYQAVLAPPTLVAVDTITVTVEGQLCVTAMRAYQTNAIGQMD